MDDFGAPTGGDLRLVVSSVSSDAHTWNLVYLQLFLEELGHEVTNLGACVPEDLLVRRCLELAPDLVLISSVNGHGWSDGARAIRALRAEPALAGIPAIIGGKLGVDGPLGEEQRRSLLDAGFDEVFDDATTLATLAGYLASVRSSQPA